MDDSLFVNRRADSMEFVGVGRTYCRLSARDSKNMLPNDSNPLLAGEHVAGN